MTIHIPDMKQDKLKKTCVVFLGSLDHDLLDAETYNSWGVDYLKYDWCSYGKKHETEPDMLIVGRLGWSANLRDTNLTPDEQYTHISLWCLLAANLLIGCDLTEMDDFTHNLLCNNEVIAVNQDVLGEQAAQVVNQDSIQVWMRQLSDGTHAVGIFNLNDTDVNVYFAKYLPILGLKNTQYRDLWRQEDISDTNFFIPSHGVKLLKVR